MSHIHTNKPNIYIYIYIYISNKHIYTASKVFCLYWLYWCICHFVGLLPRLLPFALNLFVILSSISFDWDSFHLFSFETSDLNSINFESIELTSDYYINNTNLLSQSEEVFDLTPLLFIFNSNNFKLVESTNLAFNSDLVYHPKAPVTTMQSRRHVLYLLYLSCVIYV